MTDPLESPPVGAVYVKVIVRPLWLAETTLVPEPIVPEPSAALTVMLGDAARFVRGVPLCDFSAACHVCAPVVAVAVAPGPPPGQNGGMKLVWRWVGAAFTAFVVGLVGWSLTPGSRYRPEPVEVLVAFAGIMVVGGGVAGALAYALGNTGAGSKKPGPPA